MAKQTSPGQIEASSAALPAGAATSAKQDQQTTELQDIEADVEAIGGKLPDISGTWGYHSGTNGTLNMSGSKRVLQITAIALEAAATITINGGDVITLPYGSTDKASSSITIEPRGNLTDPALIFTGTDSYFVEYVV